MPNHVTTICTVTGPEVDVVHFEATHFIAKEKGPHFDFHTIVPMPASVKETSSDSLTEIAMLAFCARSGCLVVFDSYSVLRDVVSGPRFRHADQIVAWLEKVHPKAIASAKQCFAAIIETGYGTWSEWSCANWGTKWGAYDFASRERAEGRLVFKFETAWSFPEPTFRKLAEMHPTLVFAVVSYDEGSNFACTGEFNGKNDFATVDATDELYERVYGHPKERDDEADDTVPALTSALSGGDA